MLRLQTRRAEVTSDRRQSIVARQISRLDERIDEAVFALYRLSEGEIQIVKQDSSARQRARE